MDSIHNPHHYYQQVVYNEDTNAQERIGRLYHVRRQPDKTLLIDSGHAHQQQISRDEVRQFWLSVKQISVDLCDVNDDIKQQEYLLPILSAATAVLLAEMAMTNTVFRVVPSL